MLSSTMGSWNNFRQTADATGPLAPSGDLRGRLVVSHSRRDYFYKYARDAFVLQTRLFGRSTTGTARLAFPKLLNADEVAEETLQQHEGVYRNAACTLHIRRSTRCTLLVDASCLTPEQTVTVQGMLLKPATEGIFLPDGASFSPLTIAQFVAAGADAQRYLWNGRQLFRRT